MIAIPGIQHINPIIHGGLNTAYKGSTGGGFVGTADEIKEEAMKQQTTEKTDTSEKTDTTDTQKGNSINFADSMKLVQEQQEKQWAREDEIREETQAREDTAYQRAVTDMRKAGINPNLVGVNPAESGGGITSATGLQSDILASMTNAETQKYIAEMNNLMEEYKTNLENETEISENSKNRLNEIFGRIVNVLGTIAMVFVGSKLKK